MQCVPESLIQKNPACEIVFDSVLENCVVMPEPTVLKMVIVY